MQIRARHAAARPSRRRGLLVAVGLIVAAGGAAITAGATSAAYTDHANLNLGADAGIGYQGRFDIGIVLPDGTVEQADSPTGYAWVVPGAEALVPGHSIATQIPVFNNTTDLDADTIMTVVARGADGAVSPSTPNITPYLRFSAVTSGGVLLFADAALADAHASLGVLAARRQPALAQGEAFTSGAGGSTATITLTIRYLDVPGVEDLNGGQSALAIRFDAVSVKP